MNHGGSYAIGKIFLEINSTIQKLAILRFHWQHDIPKAWPSLVVVLENHRPKFSTKVVRWMPPP